MLVFNKSSLSNIPTNEQQVSILYSLFSRRYTTDITEENTFLKLLIYADDTLYSATFGFEVRNITIISSLVIVELLSKINELLIF